MRFIIILIVLAALAGIVYILRDTIFEPLRGIATRVGSDETAEGFPVKLTGSASYSFSKVGDNFILLTDTYLYSYNANGGQIANIQHGYQNPIDKTNSKRILLYDKGAHDFSLLNRSGVIYENTLDDNIMYGSLSGNEYAAVVTNSTRYANYLYVFNGDGTQIFRWASVDNKIMQVTFSEDEKEIYVTALGSSNGELVTYLYCFDMQNAEGEKWKTAIGGGLSYELTEYAGGVLAVSSESTVLVSKDTGEITNTYAYSKTINRISIGTDNIAILFSDSLSANMVLVTLDSALAQLNIITLPASTASVYMDGASIYALIGSEIVVYNTMLEETARIALDDEYSEMIIIENSAYLLGYDIVQRIML